jgi:hypothetical protein
MPVMVEKPLQDRRRFRLALGFLALLLIAVYLLIYGGRFHVIDEVSIYAMSENLAKRGTWDTNQLVWSQWVREAREVQGDFGLNGDVYSKKGFGGALLPALLIRLAMASPKWGLVHTAFLTNPLVTALTAVLLAAYMVALGYRASTALALGLVYGLATLALPYSRTLFAEPTAGLGLLTAAYLALLSVKQEQPRWALLAGLAFSVSIWTRVVNTPLALLLAFGMWQGTRHSRRLLVPFLGSVLLLGIGGYVWYNLHRFGSLVTTGYQFTQGENFLTLPWVGFYGLLFSPFRGIFWFSPVLLAALPGAWASYRRTRLATQVALGIIVVYVALFSTWYMWWGGFAWGPRFLLPILPFAVVLTAPILEMRRARWAFAGAALLSLIVQGLAVGADFTMTETVLENTFGHPERSPAMFNPLWSPIALQARHLALGLWDIPWLQPGAGALPVFALGLSLLGLAALGLVSWRRTATRLLAGGLALCAVLAVLSGATVLEVAGRHALAEGFERDMAAATQVIARDGSPNDTAVTLAAYDYGSLLNWLRAPLPVYGLAPHEAPLRPEENQLLERALADRGGRIWLVAARILPAQDDVSAERWLTERSFLAYQQWFGDIRLLAFAPTGVPVWEAPAPMDFVDGIRLERLRLHDWPARVGKPLRVEATWQATGPVAASYTVFLHLLGPDGRLVAGQDGLPVNGYRASTTWQPGEAIVDRKAILVPADTPRGDYTLEAGLYDPQTGRRLPLLDASGADRVLIERVPVE